MAYLHFTRCFGSLLTTFKEIKIFLITYMEIIDECMKLVFVMVILFFCILTYIRVKRIIKKKKCRVGTWYNLLGVS